MKTHMLLDSENLNPADWTFVYGVYLGTLGEGAEDYVDAIGSALAELGGEEWLTSCTPAAVCRELGPELINSRFAQCGTCDHCGARFKLGMVYRHTTGALAVVGNTCAYKSLSVPDRYTLVLNRARAAAAAATKRAKNIAAADAQAAAGGFSWLYTETHTDRILTDIAGKGYAWGGLSERQIELVQRIRRGEKSEKQLAYEQRQRERAADEASKTPVIEGRIEVVGKVVAVKYVAGFAVYGPAPEVKKLILRDDRGFTVWFTCPSGFDACVGERMAVKLTVTKGDRDPCFGFGKRPSNARKLAKDGTCEARSPSR